VRRASYPNATDLSRITRRSCAFTYSLPFRYPRGRGLSMRVSRKRFAGLDAGFNYSF
jgi:hypothetical protein